MTHFEQLHEEIQNGLEGKNSSIPTGFYRFDRFVSIRKRIYSLIFGGTGCHAKGTKILMFDGTYKNVEDIKINDLLMGPDSKHRKVLELKRGQEQMYLLKQNKGLNYEINENHILNLVKLTKGKKEYINISVKDYLKKNDKFKHLWKCYKTSVEFDEKSLEIEPYFIGLWLGDGTSCKPEITTKDEEIKAYLQEFCNKYNLKLNQHKKDGLNYNLVTKTKGIIGSNCLLNYLKKENLLCNKHIPQNLLINSRKNRLELLAGLIDSDGHKEKGGGYSITLKDENLAKQVTFLSRSLGFYTSINPKKALMKRKDGSIYTSDVQRIIINGNNLYEIPCIVKRKQIISKSTRCSDALHTGFELIKTEIKDFYGFTIDSDNLYLLEDFTVTHNCGKTAFVHNAYILNPFDWWIQNKKNTNATLKPILFSMERSKLYTLSKWVSRKIFLEEGVNIQVGKMLGWWDTKLTHDEHDLIKMNEDYVNELCEFVEIYEGNRSSADIFRILKQYAEQNGVEEQVSEHKKIYIPNKPNEIVMPIVDHMGLIKRTKDTPVKKEAIDKVSEHMQYFRDFHGYSPVVVSQVNRDISNPIYQKMDSFEPNLDQIKESGRPAEDSDCVISLFQPSRYKTTDKTYNVARFINPENGADCFRKVSILKNTYGEADVGIGMGFMGSTGIFKELPKKSDMEFFDYNDILDYKYFLR